MHELAVAQNLLEIVLEHAEGAGAQRVLCINLRIGELAAIVEESLRSCFAIVSRDTAAAGAQLAFQHVPTRLRCRSCHREYEPAEGEWLCPCGAVGGEVLAGREFTIESIEVE